MKKLSMILGNKFLQFLILSMGVTFLTYCTQNSKQNCSALEDGVYWEYRNVYEIINKENEDIEYQFSDEKITSKERIELCKILNFKKIPYIISTDSVVYIRRQNVPYKYNMHIITSELFDKIVPKKSTVKHENRE